MNIFYRLFTDLSSMRPSFGTLLLVIFLLVSFVLALKQKKGGVLRNIISAYIAIVVSDFLPFFSFKVQGISAPDWPFLKIGVVLFVFFVTSFFLSRSSLGILDKGKNYLVANFILSVLGMGILFSTLCVMLPENFKVELTGISQFVFVNEVARFFWALAPIIGFVFLG